MKECANRCVQIELIPSDLNLDLCEKTQILTSKRTTIVIWHGLHWATVWIHCGLNGFRIPCGESFWKPNPWFLWPLKIYTSLHWLIDDLIMVLKPNFILCFLLYQEVSTDWRATNFINSHSDCIFPIALLLGPQNIDKIKILWNYSLWFTNVKI